MRKISIIILLFCLTGQAQVLNQKEEFTRQDSLRGSNNEFRDWWNVLKYEIEVEPDFNRKFIQGKTRIEFEVTKSQHGNLMQIDLQQPMELGEVLLNGKKVKSVEREGNVFFIETNKLEKGKRHILDLEYFGHPTVALRAPWDGGWVFAKDEKDRPWMSMACQGLGASVWFPNKDYQGDEPDNGALISIITPKDLVGVSNGRLIEETDLGNKKKFVWEVKNPINNYNIAPYIGHYVHIKDSYEGEKGLLTVDYWALDYNREKAEKQFVQSKTMLRNLEHWFGPYPFYKDGYKLVEAPYLGMEHQSGVAYGNYFMNGYLGNDLSGSGWGLKWDFIIVHESGHEWFGNNITTNEVADMWVHEGFTSYSEALFTEQQFGKEAGADYVIGTRKNIENDRPLIGVYGVNKEGSTDMYYKGSNMIHTLRHWIDDDEKFREILRGLNSEFYHKTVNSSDIEQYIAQKSELDLKPFFDQYLRTIMVPILEYSLNGDEISFQWKNVTEGFQMPVKISGTDVWLYPTTDMKTEKLPSGISENFLIDRNFYIYAVEKN